MSVLSEILAAKKTEVYCSSRRVSREELQRRIADMPPARDFASKLNKNGGEPSLIAEVKKASPSKGVIREDFDPLEIARIYADNGATCISVLTDAPYFQGSLGHLAAIREITDLPLLRKDFIIDDYQLMEARAAGADAVLLIAAALTPDQMDWMLDASAALGMAALIEIHDAEELDQVLATDAQLLGINNRDLHTFRTTLQTTVDLVPRIPEGKVIISESGINTRSDVLKLADVGVDAVLVGESLVRERDIAAKLRELLGN